MIVNLLFRLGTAHLLTDFIFQPLSWVNDRKEKKIRSVTLIWHVLLTALFAYAFSGLYYTWWIPLVILVSHFGIDLLKSYLPDKFIYFLADQVAHLAVIAGIWLVYDGQWNEVMALLCKLGASTHFWVVVFSYILVSWPFGIMIGKATSPWRLEIGESGESADSLANAGKWIGICERVLILTFVLINQFTAIGFLITAKSILRFGEKNAQKKTEYILVGTLMSFASAALLGMLVRYSFR